jgi:putative addiction module component (TIGR02574 family)
VVHASFAAFSAKLGSLRQFATECDNAGDRESNASIKSLGIDRLPVEERLKLVQEIWDSIAADSAAVPLTYVQRGERQKRIEEDNANPDDVKPWEQVKASTLAPPKMTGQF